MFTRNKLRNSPNFGGLFTRHNWISNGGPEYQNIKVLQIRQQLGEFDYGNQTGIDNTQLEFRQEQILENQAKFEG